MLIFNYSAIKYKNWLIVLLLNWVFIAQVSSQPSLLNTVGTEVGSDQTIKISADSAKFDRLANTVLYQGTVELIHGGIQLQADRLLIEMDDQQIERAIASGQPVNYRQVIEPQKIVTAKGQQLIYQAQKGIVIIRGQAELQQNTNRFSGAEIRYDLSSQAVEATNQRSDQTNKSEPSGDSERIKMIIQPPKTKTSEQAAGTNNMSEAIHKNNTKEVQP